MASLVKVGQNFMNMDQVREIRPRVGGDGRVSLRVYFGNEDTTDFGGDDAAALETYIYLQAFDVSAWYADLQVHEADWYQHVAEEEERAAEALDYTERQREIQESGADHESVAVS